MNTLKHFIAIDLGATSGRVILATLDQQGIATDVVHRFRTPMLELEGKYYWNIYSIYDEIVKGLAIAGSKGLNVESIGIDTWGVDVVGVARDGSFCGLPRAYRDPYTAGIQPRFYKKIPREELYRRTGTQTADYNTVFQLFALRREKASVLRNARHFLFMPDALGYLLTGNRICEYTIASTSGFVDPVKKKVSGDILSPCKVSRRRFPKIVMPGTRIGRLSEALGRKTGLGMVNVIAVAGHDTASAIAAVPASNANFAYLSSGTWSLMGIELAEPMITARSSELNFTNEGGVDGTTCLLKNITGMWLLEQCLERWRADGREYSYEQVHRMAEGCAPSTQVIDVDDPAFANPTDMPEAISAYCERNGIPAPVDDAHTIRLIYDSLAAKYASTLDSLRELSPVPLDTLHIIGGGARNELLDQLTADRCNIPVIAGPYEATAIGNVMVQARAAGVVRSLQEIRDFVRRSTQARLFTPR